MKEQLGLNSIEDYFKVETELNSLQNRFAASKLDLQKKLLGKLQERMSSILKDDGIKYEKLFDWNIKCDFDGSWFEVVFGKFKCDGSLLVIYPERGQLYSGIQRPKEEAPDEVHSDRISRILATMNLRSNNTWYCYRWMDFRYFESSFWSDMCSKTDEIAKKMLEEAFTYLNAIYPEGNNNAGK